MVIWCRSEDDSLAEKDERVGLPPRSVLRLPVLQQGGMSEEDIAARHFVTPSIVKQRLRLASVSNKLHDIYAEDGMTLEQLMVISVTADHARQEQIWEQVSRSGYDEPYQIQRLLTEQTLRASDRRVRFVEDATKPLPKRLITELTAHRTLALRDTLAENPEIAFQAVLHNFVLTVRRQDL
ncbi:hypothetical protein GA0061099_103417 [Bradyrhizobium yuanmingense]|uniref:Uncharacterized protein n=2 Tax=Bradyrhizobium yuanmingense TaxID=108015 RepID=A0A1C3XJV8_9BRAD|nr:hypothetical protein IQ15_07291 [Bradyrhizobium yuanmingense]SCB52543.1 hypothetical protein GA0061099_103417 [Bradyrhizobium yuanmingense]